MKTTKVGMVGKKPTVKIKPAPAGEMTAEEKAQARYERRLAAAAAAKKGKK